MPEITDVQIAGELMQEKSRVLAKMRVMGKILEGKGFIVETTYRKDKRDLVMTALHSEKPEDGKRPADSVIEEEQVAIKLMHQWKKEFEGFDVAVSRSHKLAMVARHTCEPMKNYEEGKTVPSPLNPKNAVSPAQAIVEQAVMLESGEAQDREAKKKLVAAAKAKVAREKREAAGAPKDPPPEPEQPESGQNPSAEEGDGQPTEEPEGPELDEDTGKPADEEVPAEEPQE